MYQKKIDAIYLEEFKKKKKKNFKKNIKKKNYEI